MSESPSPPSSSSDDDARPSKHLSRLMWGVALLLVVLAFVVPNIESSLSDDPDGPVDAFDEKVQAFEKRLERGEPTPEDADRALEYAAFIKARSLTEAGSLSAPEVASAVDRIDKYQSQIANQPDMASRKTLRNRRTELIVEDTAQLDEDGARDALDSVRQDYRELFGFDPGLMVELTDDGRSVPLDPDGAPSKK